MLINVDSSSDVSVIPENAALKVAGLRIQNTKPAIPRIILRQIYSDIDPAEVAMTIDSASNDLSLLKHAYR